MGWQKWVGKRCSWQKRVGKKFRTFQQVTVSPVWLYDVCHIEGVALWAIPKGISRDRAARVFTKPLFSQIEHIRLRTSQRLVLTECDFNREEVSAF